MYVLERGKLVEKKVTEILPDARRARELGDAARRRWTCDASGGRFWTALARWTQTTTTVEITVALPKGTRARDLRITLNTTSLTFWATWSGTVDACSGALARRCKVDESTWSCDGDELMIILVKDDGGRDGVPWQSVLRGSKGAKSIQDVLRDMTHADEPYAASDDLDLETKSLCEDIRDRQRMLANGELLDPSQDVDFKIGLGLR
ncbi:HSP20-like chaperone [Ostreococcus tauri]|uniref:HSP20-like chaperone n=1 Tax=Ostreococcus tauri TaxID=70448 RepID=A0A1Y5I9T4_OSTTA|nr:HSP20-like chaperone [Ostreococcus tauri]